MKIHYKPTTTPIASIDINITPEQAKGLIALLGATAPYNRCHLAERSSQHNNWADFAGNPLSALYSMLSEVRSQL